MKIQNKVVIITGASSGIGKELALQLASRSNKLVLAARTTSALHNVAVEVEARGSDALVCPTDVSDRFQVEQMVKATVDRFGRIDILINNAGLSRALGTLMENNEDDVRMTMDVNFMGCVYGIWAAVPYMEKSGGGRIVVVSSIVGKRGTPYNAIYCASKFALQGLTESIRPELKKKKIAVINVCPPGVGTPFFVNNRRGGLKRYRLHPVGKIARRIIRACENGKRDVVLAMDARLLQWVSVLFPRLTDWLIEKHRGI